MRYIGTLPTKQSVPDPSPKTCNYLNEHSESDTIMTYKVMRDIRAAAFLPYSHEFGSGVTLYGEATVLKRLYRRTR